MLVMLVMLVMIIRYEYIFIFSVIKNKNTIALLNINLISYHKLSRIQFPAIFFAVSL